METHRKLARMSYGQRILVFRIIPPDLDTSLIPPFEKKEVRGN